MRLHPQSDSHAHTKPGRGGFTLTEILVVIAIIALLAGMAAWAAVAMIANQQRKNTQSTMRVINKLLMTRWQAVVADAKKETPSPYVLFTFAGNDPEVARVLWIKVRLAEAFPQKYSDASPSSFLFTKDVNGNIMLPPNRRKPYFLKYQSVLGALPGGTPGESSACLLVALKSLQADSTAVDDQVKHAVVATDGAPGYTGSVNAINTLIDAYEMPLQFKRFSIDVPNPALPSSRNFKFGDTTDSDGRLLVPVNQWYGSIQMLKFKAAFHWISPDDVNAYYVTPLVWSLGKDRAGTTKLADAVNQDNIYSAPVPPFPYTYMGDD
jgi:prepilin-type N-terminal cleavage/methylation domain-containing protein